MSTHTQYKEDLLKEIETLPSEKIKEVLDFICYIKAKEFIDPSQAYFWSRQWQQMEKEADIDKERGNIIGNGTAEDLIQKLRS